MIKRALAVISIQILLAFQFLLVDPIGYKQIIFGLPKYRHLFIADFLVDSHLFRYVLFVTYLAVLGYFIFKKWVSYPDFLELIKYKKPFKERKISSY
jgi:hypothetical protein